MIRAGLQGTMRFGSTAEVLTECKLKYYRISECRVHTASMSDRLSEGAASDG